MSTDGLVVFISCTFVLLSLFCLDEYRDFQNSQKLKTKIETLNEERRKKVARLEGRIDSLERRSQDVTFLALALWTESKNPKEYPYIANVVRNRVEKKWRGASTYREVVIDPAQFSGMLIRPRGDTWEKARQIAYRTIHMPDSSLLLEKNVTHFYSPRSLSYTPRWAYQGQVVQTSINSRRFRFFKNVE